MPKICLNMIVRNESARIERCLQSLDVDSYVIADTGSTDGTPDLIKAFFKERGIKGNIVHIPFINFEQARNAALIAARLYHGLRAGDYILLCDADMEMKVDDVLWKNKLTGPCYDVVQRAGDLTYYNRRLVRSDQKGLYRGVTHEYLDIGGEQILDGVWFVDHADGENRKDKLVRDIALLEEALKTDPNNGRSWFYLAQSHRDAGNHCQAADCYKRRVQLGGWDEEVWNAQCNYAACLRSLGDEGGFIRETLVAYNMRPTRAESLYDLAKFFRVKGQNAPAVLFAEAAMEIPRTTDVLFVSEYAYHTGPREEFSIAGFYLPEKREKAFKVCDSVANDKAGNGGSRAQARQNLLHYVKPLPDMIPSFTKHNIPFTPPDGYVALNPSIVSHEGQIVVNIRTVNYHITDSGHYMIRGYDGSVNNSNPINTRNFLVELDKTFEPVESYEVLWPRPPAQYGLVTGLEDMRIFLMNDKLYASACCREQNPEGYCEQVLVHLDMTGGSPLAYSVVEWKHIRPKERLHEKNWAPFVVGDRIAPRWLYRLGSVVDVEGTITPAVRNHLDDGHMSGGSQVIQVDGAYITVVHEAWTRENGTRIYTHRFAMLDQDGGLAALSLPFVFEAKQIEFAAGMALHPDGKRLMISYGVRDCEACIATVDVADVMGLLHD